MRAGRATAIACSSVLPGPRMLTSLEIPGNGSTVCRWATADLLIERAAADVSDRANVIYAALFCYRQSIELFLKRLIDEFDVKAYRHNNTYDLRVL